MKIMSLYAHPADHFSECGGTLALHAEHGDEIVLVTLTHGGRIHPNIYIKGKKATREEVIEFKRKELERAAECIGVKRLINLDFEDNYIGVRDEMVNKLAEVLAKEAPDVVITDYPLNPFDADNHTVASTMFFNALNQVGLYLESLDGDKAKREFNLKQIFMTKISVWTRDCFSYNVHNDMYIDITPVVGKKVKAMDQFVSQGYDGNYARKAIESVDGVYGKAAFCNFAEGFARYTPETRNLLPIADSSNQGGDGGTGHEDYSVINLRAEYPYEPPVE